MKNLRFSMALLMLGMAPMRAMEAEQIEVIVSAPAVETACNGSQCTSIQAEEASEDVADTAEVVRSPWKKRILQAACAAIIIAAAYCLMRGGASVTPVLEQQQLNASN